MVLQGKISITGNGIYSMLKENLYDYELQILDKNCGDFDEIKNLLRNLQGRVRFNTVHAPIINNITMLHSIICRLAQISQ